MVRGRQKRVRRPCQRRQVAVADERLVAEAAHDVGAGVDAARAADALELEAPADVDAGGHT
jgi:hypothetical protein